MGKAKQLGIFTVLFFLWIPYASCKPLALMANGNGIMVISFLF